MAQYVRRSVVIAAFLLFWLGFWLVLRMPDGQALESFGPRVAWMTSAHGAAFVGIVGTIATILGLIYALAAPSAITRPLLPPTPPVPSKELRLGYYIYKTLRYDGAPWRGLKVFFREREVNTYVEYSIVIWNIGTEHLRDVEITLGIPDTIETFRQVKPQLVEPLVSSEPGGPQLQLRNQRLVTSPLRDVLQGVCPLMNPDEQLTIHVIGIVPVASGLGIDLSTGEGKLAPLIVSARAPDLRVEQLDTFWHREIPVKLSEEEFKQMRRDRIAKWKAVERELPLRTRIARTLARIGNKAITKISREWFRPRKDHTLYP